MTRGERAKIQRAIDLLTENDPRMQEALILLGSMVGIRFPGMEDAVRARTGTEPVIDLMAALRDSLRQP